MTCCLDALTLAVAINDANIGPSDLRLGSDLLPIAERIIARIPMTDTPAALDVDTLGFDDLLDVGEAILRRYPDDTIVCSHHPEADPGALTTAAIADLIRTARLSRSAGP